MRTPDIHPIPHSIEFQIHENGGQARDAISRVRGIELAVDLFLAVGGEFVAEFGGGQGGEVCADYGGFAGGEGGEVVD